MKQMMFSQEQRITLRNYKYSGKDQSYLYIYVLSPIAEHCVQWFVPGWIAPNVITLAALIISLITTTITLICNPSLGPNNPSWLSILIGITVLLYQTLDNMDGKQARRTNSSSPLGMLFDHGCDAINATLLSISMSSCFGCGWTMKLFFGYFISHFAFYIQTWESYYIESFILPIINGPSDGLVFTAGCAFVSAYYGSAMWQSSTIDVSFIISTIDHISPVVNNFLDLRSINSHVFISPLGVIIVAVVTMHIGIFLIQFRQGINAAVKRGISVWKAIADLILIFVLYFGYFLWCLISPIALSKYPIIATMNYGLIFFDLSFHVMVRHVIHGSIDIIGRYLLCSIFILIWLAFYTDKVLMGLTMEELALFVSTVVSMVQVIMVVKYTTVEACDILRIHVFILGKRDMKLC